MPATLITDTWRKPVAWASALAVVLAAALAAVVHGSSTAFDSWMFRELYHHIGTNGALSLLDLSSPALPLGILAIVAVSAALLRRWDVVALAVTGPGLAVGLTKYVLKPLISRPLSQDTVAQLFGIHLTTGGFTVDGVFPSGHETAVASTALVLLVVAGQLPLRARGRTVVVTVLGLWTLLAAVGLVRNFWHYATDTIGAICISVAVIGTVALVIDRLGSRVSAPDVRSPASTTRAA